MRKNSSNRTSGLWPTPDYRDHHAEGMEAGKRRLEKWGTIGLQTAAHLSLEIYPPSTEPPTEAQPYLPGGFLASHFPRPGSAEARRMTVISGRRCSELYTKPGPLGCLVRTFLESSRWNSTECFLTWKVKATPSNRLLFQLAPSTPNTGEIESGLWLTPRPQDDGSSVEKFRERMIRNGARAHQFSGLTQQVKMRPTPHGMSKDGRSNGPSGNELGNAVNRSMWPTVTARDGRTLKGAQDRPNRTGGKSLAQVQLDAGHVSGSLNPTFVEWLMGYPKHWTEVK